MPNPSQQIPLPLASHNNQSLFSDHYVDDILRHSPTWQTAACPLSDWLHARYTHIIHLSRRLAATNCLIDQIVYQLYGLTPEEIAIIEA